jgi:DNA-directed RNA polymerase subunit F
MAIRLRAVGLTIARMLNSTLTYLDNFARFTQKENVEAVERLLSAHKNLAKFERAQLGTISRSWKKLICLSRILTDYL